MKIQLKSDEDLTIVTKGGGNVIVPNNTDTSTDKTLATVDQIGPGGEDKANSASLAAPYETDHSSAYVIGDYVTHEGALYKCKSDTSSPPGEWDDNKWDAVAVTDEMGGGGAKNVWYGTCETAASINEKVVTTTTGDFVYEVGNIIVVWFKNDLGAAATDPKLKVDLGSAAGIRWMGATPPIRAWNAKQSVTFVYDGTYFQLAFGRADTMHWGITTLTNTVDPNYTSFAATPAAVATRAPLASPTFKGTPKAPTAAAGTNTTQIATTEFVQREISNLPDSDRIVSENENTKVVANNDGTATIDKNVLTSRPIVHLTAGTFSGYNEIVLQNDVTADMNQAIHEYGSRYRLTIDGIDFYYIFDGNHPDLGRSFTVGLNYEFDITDWDNVNPTITLKSGTSYTGVASVSRHAIDSKVIATVDQIVVVDVVDPTTDGSGTGKAADANSTGLALELTPATFSNWKTVPTTYNGYPITIELRPDSKTWVPFANHNQIGIGYPDENQTSLNWSSDFASIPISASRSVIGYVLGEQTDKELAAASAIGDINSVLDAINGEEI